MSTTDTAITTDSARFSRLLLRAPWLAELWWAGQLTTPGHVPGHPTTHEHRRIDALAKVCVSSNYTGLLDRPIIEMTWTCEGYLERFDPARVEQLVAALKAADWDDHARLWADSTELCAWVNGLAYESPGGAYGPFQWGQKIAPADDPRLTGIDTRHPGTDARLVARLA